MVSSSVQGGGRGRLGAQSYRHAFHPLLGSPPWPDVQGREGTAGGHKTPTLPRVHGNHRAQAAGVARDPFGRESAQAFSGTSLTSRAESGPWDEEPCRCVLPGLLGSISHLIPRNLVGGKAGHWDSRVMLVKPGRAPELSWGLRGGEVLGLSL